METQKIQATITLELTQEQLLMLLNAQPPAPQPTPAPMPQTVAPASAPQNQPTFAPQGHWEAPASAGSAQMFTAMPTATPAQMPTAQQIQQNPLPQAQPMPTMTPAPMQNPMPQIPAAQPMQTPSPAPMPVQTAPQTYTVEQLGLAARPLVESGRREELVALLTEFGVPSVAAIPEDRRADFAARLRAMGGQI